MNSKHPVWMLLLLANGSAFGQAAGAARSSAALAAATTITIQGAPTGALVRSQGAGNASVDLGPISYFKGPSAPGETSQQKPASFVISTRFGLKVDCPRNSSSQVYLTVSRLDTSASHAIAVDGIALGSVEQMLAPSMPCGSSGEHRLDLEVPVSTPAGPIGSTLVFTATLRQ